MNPVHEELYPEKDLEEEAKVKMDLIRNRKHNLVRTLIGKLDPKIEDMLRQVEIEAILDWTLKEKSVFLLDPISSPCHGKHTF